MAVEAPDHERDAAAGSGTVRERLADRGPSTRSGEPLLPRWFAIVLVLSVPAVLGLAGWSFATSDREPVSVAERRPLASASETHVVGSAQSAPAITAEPARGCASRLSVAGNVRSQAVLQAALDDICTLVQDGSWPAVDAGIAAASRQEAVVRFATFASTGVDSRTARVIEVQGAEPRTVIELNARFGLSQGASAIPMLMHELVHLGADWPFAAVAAETELQAMRIQNRACDQIVTRVDQLPRGCADAAAFLRATNPVDVLVEQGWPTGAQPDEASSTTERTEQ